MALVFKDLAKEKNVKWAAKIFTASIIISTVVGDSERALLGEDQAEKYGTKSALTTNDPTRFAVNYVVLRFGPHAEPGEGMNDGSECFLMFSPVRTLHR